MIHFQEDDSLISNTVQDSDPDINVDDCYESRNLSQLSPASSSSSSSSPSSSSYYKSHNDNKKRKANTDLRQQAIGKCMDIIQNKRVKDDCAIYGEYIASELRTIRSNDLLFAMTKQKINQVMAESVQEFFNNSAVMIMNVSNPEHENVIN